MHFSCTQIFAFLFLLAGTGLVITSIATSFWTHRDTAFSAPNDPNGALTYYHRGLYERCYQRGQSDIHCDYLFDKILESQRIGNLNDQFQPWEIACLALMGLSGLVGLLGLLSSPCCCNSCGVCLANTVLTAALCASAGISTYAYYQMTSMGEGLDDVVYFGWSFWVAIGGAGMQMFAFFLFLVARCQMRSSSEYTHQI